ncbi:hypothetical protein V1527DRAFT_482637 [Lipomyces starkeyi]
MLGVAIRIAQRIGIHNESALANTPLSRLKCAEDFGSRSYSSTLASAATLIPTWDCRIPLNVNDSDFRLEMKEPHRFRENLPRHFSPLCASGFKAHANDVEHGPIPEGSALVSLEKMIEDKYLKFCDPENPPHFMTIWTTRAYLAKCRLMEHHSRYSSSSAHQAEAQRDAAISYALSMLECDTEIMTSPLTKGFLWLVHFYLPFIAYIQVVQNLKRRPSFLQTLHENCPPGIGGPRGYIQALGGSLVTPRIVLSIRQAVPKGATDMGFNDFPMSMPMGFGSHGLLYSMGGQDGYAVTGPAYPDMPGLAPLDVDVNQLDWSAMDWDLVNDPAGEAANIPFCSPGLPAFLDQLLLLISQREIGRYGFSKPLYHHKHWPCSLKKFALASVEPSSDDPSSFCKVCGLADAETSAINSTTVIN